MGGRMKWFKYGCFGCLGLLALLLVIAGTIGGLAWQRSTSIKMEDRVVTRDLPGEAGGPGTQGVPAGDLAADMPGSADSPGGPAAGRVLLDLSSAEFRIEPGEPGEPIRVEGSFDRSRYALEESFESAEGGSWEYTVRFRRVGGSGLITALSEFMGGARPRVTVRLPPDHPMALDIELKRGGLEADLGGLWLTQADLDLAMGGSQVRFDTPLRQPMGRLAIKGRMGGGSFEKIGNASPSILEVGFEMGGMNLDLGGDWANDAEISIKASMGGGSVRLPRGVSCEGLPEDAGECEAAGPQSPTLSFTISARKKDLKFY